MYINSDSEKKYIAYFFSFFYILNAAYSCALSVLYNSEFFPPI